MSPAPIRMEGVRYGRLLAVEEVRLHGRKAMRCLCDCGAEKTVEGMHLRSGAIKSCGCLKTERQTSHGLTGTPEHIAWVNMKSRCSHEYNPYYGARGVKVCPEWRESFEAFLGHIGPRPGPGYSVDRIDAEGDYEPGNVRWATAEQQVQNRRPVPGVTVSLKPPAEAERSRTIGRRYRARLRERATA